MNHKLHGEASFYFMDGNISYKQTYKHDEIIEDTYYKYSSENGKLKLSSIEKLPLEVFKCLANLRSKNETNRN